ncbi:MAG: helix-turn-helix domain-containing protein [Chloroflexi bacterium]|nr:helix-turn-helix domain-containing protein [Chloroflexota bacterium]
MSSQALSWAWEQDLPASEKLVLLALAECALPSGLIRSGPAAQGELAALTGAKPRTVRGNLPKLEERKLLRRFAYYEHGNRCPDVMMLAVNGTLDLPADIASGRSGRVVQSSTAPIGVETNAGEESRARTESLFDDGDLPPEMVRDAQELLRQKKKVDRRIVTENEMMVAAHALAEFNRQLDSDYGLGSQVTTIVMRIRDRPSWGAAKHVRLVQSAFRLKWWEQRGSRRRPTPAVIYGERAFDQVVQDATEEARGKKPAERSGRFTRRKALERES